MTKALLQLAGILFVAELVAHVLLSSSGVTAPPWLGPLLDAGMMVAFAAFPVLLVVVRPLVERLRQERAELSRREARLRAEAERRELEVQLASGLLMRDDERSVCGLAERAASMLAGGAVTQVLLADSSRAHLRVVQTKDEQIAPACSVRTPRGCPAVRTGRGLVFQSADELDACPHLVPRSGAGTACFPLAVVGENVGVIHINAPHEICASEKLAVGMGSLSPAVGNRLGILRAMAASELAASRDPLTGLCNRRSFEDRAGEALRAGVRFGLVLLDVDHFKRLNDTHGHETGDRSLKMLAQVLRCALREADTAARFGGEEFVLLLPGADVAGSRAVVERIRAQLPLAAVRAGVPSFTLSFGITDTTYQTDIEELLRAADEALYAAKRGGRDRAVVAGETLEAEGVGATSGARPTTTPSLRAVESLGAAV